METPDPDTLVQRFLDGDLSESELEQALHRIAADPEARDLLQFELRMTQDFAASRSSAPPSDFASETVAALPADRADASDTDSASSTQWLRELWQRVTTPVTVPVRPAHTIVATLLLSVGAWALWPAPPSPSPTDGRTSVETVQSASSPQSVAAESAASGDRETVWIRFLYPNDDADSVAVAGDFNQWTPVALTPRTVDGRTVWTGLVPVPRGEHEYQFVINGERWVPDPLAPETRSDGFGAKNAVLEI